MRGMNNEIQKLQKVLDRIAFLRESQRVPVSLKRFDRWMHMFVRSQSLRWLLIEIGMPLAIGVAGVVALGLDLWPHLPTH